MSRQNALAPRRGAGHPRGAAARAGRATGRPVRRVREEVRDGLVVVAFSATSSTALAVALMLLVRVAG
jgi:hypothetical protein